nr:aspartate aminotransferase family protein [uncultured Chitinophaga sp.]
MGKFDKFHLANSARIITGTVPGPVSRQLLERQQEKEGSIVSYPKNMPIAIRRAKGAIIEDADGNHFIDFFSGAGVLNVGHCNSYVLRYVKEQQDELIHVLDFPTENKMQLIDKMLEQIPENLRSQYKISFCGPTGSDAVEAAIKLAKHKTGREGVIAFHGSYHGMTSGSLAMTSNTKFRERIKSLVPNIHFVPYSYCYRCPFQQEQSSCKMDCANYLQYILENPHSGIAKPAAIILEPIQGEGGTVVPQKGYLEAVVAIARKHDIVVIFDEIQCGFFRTGQCWAFQDSHCFPDVITMSKGLGGVGFPISAIIYNKAVESWGQGDHVGTFRGNQVSIAAGNGAFDFVKEYEVDKHAVEMGRYLTDKLNALQTIIPAIGEVRGRGLFIGLEYVKDRETKVPDPEIVKEIRMECFKQGLLFESGGHYNNVIRFIPPLIVNAEIIDNAVRIFEEVNKMICLGHRVAL